MASVIAASPEKGSGSREAAFPHGHIPTLDGWRGVAILMVVAGHVLAVASHRGFAPETDSRLAESLGKHGVTIFFVLSGYLITSRLLREQERNGSISLKSFYTRRFFRLMPAAWAYLLFISILFLASGQSLVSLHLPACLLCFRNYAGKAGGGGLTVHFWSLSLEEQFYLVWPTVLIVAGRKRSLWIAIAGTLAVAAWRLHCWAWLKTLVLESQGTQYRADSILIGCALALLVPRIAPLVRKWMFLPLLSIFIYCVARGFTLIPLYESIVMALLLLITVQNSRGFAGRVLESKFLVKAGHFSYSIYLWQALLFATHSVRGIAVTFVFVAVTSVMSYFFIEEPSIRYGKLIQARWQRTSA